MSEATLGRAMTAEELSHLNKAVLDITAFDYSDTPVLDKHYFQKRFPGFHDSVYDIMLMYERGMRAKEFKRLLTRKKAKESRRSLMAVKSEPFADD